MKLFVGGLAWATDSNGLRAAFEQHGKVTEAVVVQDRETGRSRGFGFVTFENDAEGRAALQAMNGATLDGRAIRCDEASASDRPGGGGGGGGGFRGGGGGGGVKEGVRYGVWGIGSEARGLFVGVAGANSQLTRNQRASDHRTLCFIPYTLCPTPYTLFLRPFPP